MSRIPLASELPLPQLPISPFMRTIVSLRLAGFGYKRIARTLRITRDDARSYARSAGLDGVRGSVPQRGERPAPSRASSCARCGAAIVIRQRGRPARFCSQRCRDAADYASGKTGASQRTKRALAHDQNDERTVAARTRAGRA